MGQCRRGWEGEASACGENEGEVDTDGNGDLQGVEMEEGERGVAVFDGVMEEDEGDDRESDGGGDE